MKKFYVFSACVFALASCGEKDLYDGASEQQQQQDGKQSATQEEIVENMNSRFGVALDTKSDWSMLNNGTVTVTANAAMSDVAYVRILTASPFGNSEAKILNEAKTSIGQKVTLTYDAPKDLTRLYAACVSKSGEYRIKGFNIGQQNVSFDQQSSSRRVICHAAWSESKLPQVDRVEQSYNAQRAANPDSTNMGWTAWEGSKWADKCVISNIDQLWIDEPDFTEDEKLDFRDILFTYLPEFADNRNKVNQNEFYTSSNNYMTSTGARTITVTPLHCGAGWIGAEHLYYYYYKESELPADEEAQVEFFKSLPKYKLIQYWRMYNNSDLTPEQVTQRNKYDLTYKAHCYTLAFFGDNDDPKRGDKGQWTFPAGYKIGFMLRVLYNNKRNGCLYSDGRLNDEINTYGDFKNDPLNRLNGKNASRTVVFGANGANIVSFEDGVDNDFNDIVFAVEGGVNIIQDQINLDRNVYTYGFEDRDLGDYDLNDVVVKAQRVDLTHVLYSLEATGAQDELFLRNINGSRLNETTEVHNIFDKTDNEGFVNTKDSVCPAVQELIEVPAGFSFADKKYQIHIFNKTTNKDIYVAEAGQDPHAILVPYDWKYPKERTCVKDAYDQTETLTRTEFESRGQQLKGDEVIRYTSVETGEEVEESTYCADTEGKSVNVVLDHKFNNWGVNRVASTDWFRYPNLSRVYQHSVFKGQ